MSLHWCACEVRKLNTEFRDKAVAKAKELNGSGGGAGGGGKSSHNSYCEARPLTPERVVSSGQGGKGNGGGGGKTGKPKREADATPQMQQQQQPWKVRKTESGPLCYNCNQRGHLAKDCTSPPVKGKGKKGGKAKYDGLHAGIAGVGCLLYRACRW